MQNELFNQGLILMLAGMGTVFVFLTLLVIAMSGLAAVVQRWPADDESSGEEELAAAAAAVRAHRQK